MPSCIRTPLPTSRFGLLDRYGNARRRHLLRVTAFSLGHRTPPARVRGALLGLFGTLGGGVLALRLLDPSFSAPRATTAGLIQSCRPGHRDWRRPALYQSCPDRSLRRDTPNLLPDSDTGR